MPDFNSPNTGNYAIFKGDVYFTPAGGTRRHMGNCTQFDFQLTADRLDHFSSMSGIKSKDKSAVIQQTGTISLTLEEMTKENFAIALLADTGESTDGDVELDIGANTEINGRLELIGSNDIGPKWTYDLPNVNLTPNGAVAMINSDASNWNSIQVTGDVLIVTSKVGYTDNTFGKAILQESTITEEGTA